MFLPRSDLKALTGYSRTSAQVRWLRRNGWKFIVNGIGEPVVAVAEVSRHLVGGKASKNQEPDLQGING